jgi:hypothetical protein
LVESALQPIQRVIKQSDGDIGAGAPECPDKVADACRRERLQDASPQHARGCNSAKIGLDAVARPENTASRLEEPASGTPILVSSFATAADNAGCDTATRAAPLVKLPVSATATNCRI